MSLDSLFMDMGYAGLAGFIVGFAVRRVLNVFMMLMGLYLLSLMWLSSKGIVQVQWEQLFIFYRDMLGSFTQFLKELVGKVAFAGSFAVGFAVGFRV